VRRTHTPGGASPYHGGRERAVAHVESAGVEGDELVGYAGALPHDVRVEVGGAGVDGRYRHLQRRRVSPRHTADDGIERK
jgi:hypothetical protein